MNLYKKLMADERVVYLYKGILVGLFSGIIVSLFRLGIEMMLEKVSEAYQLFKSEPIWLLAWIPLTVAVAGVIGWLVKSEPNIKGSGIPQVEGQVQGIMTLKWWPILWKKFIGGYIGNWSRVCFWAEKVPAIQMGSAIGQGVSQLTKGDDVEERILLSSGAGAGLAAAFNAPLAGLMFVFEEIHHNFSPLVGITTLSSALVANFVSLNIFGLTPVLNIGAMTTLPITYYGLVVLLGIFLGFCGWLYNKLLLSMPKIYGKIKFIPSNFNGIIPLLLVIPIGYFLPQISGSGSDLVMHLGNWKLSIGMLIGLFVFRFLFSVISYGANVPGGILLPILSLGAILGALYGQVAISIFDFEPQYLPHFIIICDGRLFYGNREKRL